MVDHPAPGARAPRSHARWPHAGVDAPAHWPPGWHWRPQRAGTPRRSPVEPAADRDAGACTGWYIARCDSRLARRPPSKLAGLMHDDHEGLTAASRAPCGRATALGYAQPLTQLSNTMQAPRLGPLPGTLGHPTPQRRGRYLEELSRFRRGEPALVDELPSASPHPPIGLAGDAQELDELQLGAQILRPAWWGHRTGCRTDSWSCMRYYRIGATLSPYRYVAYDKPGAPAPARASQEPGASTLDVRLPAGSRGRRRERSDPCP
jgi:hypothetical protein